MAERKMGVDRNNVVPWGSIADSSLCTEQSWVTDGGVRVTPKIVTLTNGLMYAVLVDSSGRDVLTGRGCLFPTSAVKIDLGLPDTFAFSDKKINLALSNGFVLREAAFLGSEKSPNIMSCIIKEMGGGRIRYVIDPYSKLLSFSCAHTTPRDSAFIFSVSNLGSGSIVHFSKSGQPSQEFNVQVQNRRVQFDFLDEDLIGIATSLESLFGRGSSETRRVSARKVEKFPVSECVLEYLGFSLRGGESLVVDIGKSLVNLIRGFDSTPQEQLVTLLKFGARRY